MGPTVWVSPTEADPVSEILWFLGHQMMDRAQKLCNPDCFIHSYELFRMY
jgi:hypothetical protein